MADEESVAANSTESTKGEHLKAYHWKPGQSGNPSGRPKKKLIDHALTELLEALDSEQAKEIAKQLIERAKTDSLTAKLVAERTEGKPIQKVEVTGEDGGPVSTSLVVSFVGTDGK